MKMSGQDVKVDQAALRRKGWMALFDVSKIYI